MIVVRKKQLTSTEQRIEQFADKTKGVALNIAKIIASYSLIMFITRWFFIMLGEDVRPTEIIEQKALNFFRKIRGEQ